jgi:F0F1-type ATP synthase assembly protein I
MDTQFARMDTRMDTRFARMDDDLKDMKIELLAEIKKANAQLIEFATSINGVKSEIKAVESVVTLLRWQVGVISVGVLGFFYGKFSMDSNSHVC